MKIADSVWLSMYKRNLSIIQKDNGWYLFSSFRWENSNLNKINKTLKKIVIKTVQTFNKQMK
jgi:hypothetical protein